MFRLRNVIALFIMICITISGSTSWSQKPKSMHAPPALPGVEPEMLTPEYWIGLQKDADEVIMTPAEIEQFNTSIRNKKGDTIRYEGPLRNPLLPLELPDTLPGNNIRVRLKSNSEKLFNPDDLYGSREYYDGRNTIYSESMKQEIVEDMNPDAIPGVITRRFGIIVNHTSVRQYPTHVPGYSETEWEMDRFQITDLCTGNPVAILHESTDGDFLYVESPISMGWIAAEDIAIAERREIRELAEDDNLLMAAGNKVPVYGDSSCKNFARYFYFSATMPLIRHDSRGYVVKMAYRNPDGSLGVVNGYIKPGADVHIGYFPYTKRNILTQFFKILHTPYGWHGQFNKRDCSGSLRVLFRCCGIVTGRSSGRASRHQITIDTNLSTEQKTAKIAEIEPVITIASDPGHVVLYIGKAHNGKLYFMHQCGWGYDENDIHYYVNRVTINSAEHPLYPVDRPRLFTTLRK
ncbi:SH3 domain-containing protein [Candidatus Latescibacterota bacterium]